MEEQAQNSIHQSNNNEQGQTAEENKMEIVDTKVQSNKKSSPTGFVFDKNYFFDRSFHEVEDGHYDEEGFYHTPEGSFWNDEQDYFNRYGYDKYGGKYNSEGVYIPGEGWDSDLQCYKEDIDKDFLEKKADEIEGIIEERIQMMNNVCDISITSDNLEEDLLDEEKEKKTDFLNIKEIIREEIEEFSQKTGLNVNVQEVLKEIAPLYHDNYENTENKQVECENEENKNQSEEILSKEIEEKNNDNSNNQESKPDTLIANAIIQNEIEIEDKSKLTSASKIVNNNIIINSDAKANPSKKLGEENNKNSNNQSENTSNIMFIEKPITPSKVQINSKTPIKSAIKSVSKSNNV